MALRLHAYLMDFFMRCAEQGYEKLPPAVTCLFYQGKTSPYPHPCNIIELFEDKDWARLELFKPFHIVDVTQKEDKELLNHGKAAVMEMLQKHVWDSDISPVLKKLDEEGCFKKISTYRDYIRFVIKYVMQEGGNTEGKKNIIHCLSEALPEQEENIMTAAQQLMQEGRKQLLKQSVQNMLTQGVSKEKIKSYMCLSDEELIEAIES